MCHHDQQTMNITFEQTGPIYFTENRNSEEKREFPIIILMNNKIVFIGTIYDGDYFNLVYEDQEYLFEEIMEQILRVQDFWQMEGCGPIQKCYLDFVKSVYQHGNDVLNGKAHWNQFKTQSAEL